MAKFSPTKSDSVFISSANKRAATQSPWSRIARFSAPFLPKKWLDIKVFNGHEIWELNVRLREAGDEADTKSTRRYRGSPMGFPGSVRFRCVALRYSKISEIESISVGA